MQDEKLKERISLLMRFFWLDDLFKIGKELNLLFFEKIQNYWEMNQYQAATEIARNIDDTKLLELTKKYIPKYGLQLGGFHGKYYTTTETGEIRFEDSSNLIKTNVQKALKKWGDRAYGLLQAMVNKNGHVTYFDLIDEIEKVLGYEFIPSYLLSRFAPLNLVFKTGSNKYPDWTMPSEIIPIVQEELRNFKRPARRYLTKETPDIHLLKIEKETSSIVDKIVEFRRNINLLFEQKFKTKFFKQNEMAINDIRKPCSNEEEFNNRIMSLALLIDEIETESILKLVTSKPQYGSINILESFLNEKYPNYNKTIIKNLRFIMTLRSKKYPVHRDDVALIDALGYFGFTELPPDWQELWEACLKRYLDSIQGLISILIATS
ncbi:hypothetical protein HYW99_01370 [Candidatus Woesearchaeota archaeon]|nr:hypothetical protein [Candidatus Aenigmarchaeota archaeon]MBI2647101.1 hypothetical protein [Candidatus Woesearchaeota archaeon]